MGAALLVARSRLRANVPATILLVVLAGLGGGIVMASIASIRRADGSWLRFQDENPPGDAGVVFLGPDGEPPNGLDRDLETEIHELQAMPGVESAVRATAAIGMLHADGQRYAVAANLYLDAPRPALVGRPVIVEGRMPDPSSAEEVAIDELLADRLGLGAGDPFTFAHFELDELQGASDGRDFDPDGAPSDLVVTGVVRHPGDLLPPRTDQYALYADEPYLLLGPAWWEANGPDVGNYALFVMVELDSGTEFDEFEATLAERFGDGVFAVPGIDEVGTPEEVGRAVDRQIAAEGRAVAVFAVVVALVAVALLSLALARQLSAESADQSRLRALGMSRRALVAVNVLRSLTIAVGAGAVAVLVAIGLSIILPVGVGRRTLRASGIDIDVTVFAAGFVAIAVGVVLLVALLGWRVGRPRHVRTGRLSLANRIARAGAPVPATVGVHFALERSPADRAAGTAIAVVALAVAVVVASAGVVGSFRDLRDDPARQGQVWDASAGNFAGPEGLEQGLATLDDRADVSAVAGELSAPATIADRSVTAAAYVPYEGELETTLHEGRPLRAPDEMVIGANLARTLGVEIGDRLPVGFAFEEEPLELEVVGIGPIGALGYDLDPSRAVLVHHEVSERDPEAIVSVLLIRFRPDADRAAAIARLKEEFPQTVLVAPVPSRPVQTLDGLTILPLALAGVVALLALAAAANGAVTAVRRRTREVAVLKVLGLKRRQVRSVLHWQAFTWAVIALVLGVPSGIVLGAVGWRATVRSLGLEAPMSVPLATTLVVVVLAPAVLLAMTWWPGRRAAETRPASVLRSE